MYRQSLRSPIAAAGFAAVVGLASASAQSATFSILDPTSPSLLSLSDVESLGGSNDITAGRLSPDDGTFHARAQLNVADFGPADSIDYYFWGKEAGFANEFTSDQLTFTNPSSPPLTSIPAGNVTLIGSNSATDGDRVDFQFLINGNSTDPLENILADNDQGPNSDLPNFILAYLDPTVALSDPQVISETATSRVLVLLDDGSVDDDHDDMGIIANISAVPVPAALPMFFAALGAIAVVGWRRQHNTTP